MFAVCQYGAFRAFGRNPPERGPTKTRVFAWGNSKEWINLGDIALLLLKALTRTGTYNDTCGWFMLVFTALFAPLVAPDASPRVLRHMLIF